MPTRIDAFKTVGCNEFQKFSFTCLRTPPSWQSPMRETVEKRIFAGSIWSWRSQRIIQSTWFLVRNDILSYLIHSQSFFAAAALAVQIWEAVICSGDEVEYLWRWVAWQWFFPLSLSHVSITTTRGKIGSVKLVYGCSRYLLLLGQMFVSQNSSRPLHD